jgi:hypothetical protein
MARYYYQVNGAVSSVRTVSYRFVCEYCGKDSGELTKVLKGESQLNATNVKIEKNTSSVGAHVSADSIAMHHEYASSDAAIKELRLYEDVKRGYYPFSDKCPHCRKHQSWGNRYRYFYGGSGFWGMIGLTFAWAILWTLPVAGIAFFAISRHGSNIDPDTTASFLAGMKSLNLDLTFWQFMRYSYLLGLLVTPFITFCGYIIHKLQTTGVKERRKPTVGTLNQREIAAKQNVQSESECKHKLISNKSSSRCVICNKIVCFHHWTTHSATQYRCMGCGEIIAKF